MKPRYLSWQVGHGEQRSGGTLPKWVVEEQSLQDVPCVVVQPSQQAMHPRSHSCSFPSCFDHVSTSSPVPSFSICPWNIYLVELLFVLSPSPYYFLVFHQLLVSFPSLLPLFGHRFPSPVQENIPNDTKSKCVLVASAKCKWWRKLRMKNRKKGGVVMLSGVWKGQAMKANQKDANTKMSKNGESEQKKKKKET